MRIPRLPLLPLLAFLVFAGGCSGKVTRDTKMSDRELFSAGDQAFRAKKHGKAANHFQVLLEKYPASPLAPGAQLLLAEALEEDGEELEAEIAYDDFLRLYPASDNVPRALFRKAELVASQAKAPGRDQTRTQEAIRTYGLYLEKAPAGPRAEEARTRIASLRNRLAEHEAEVAGLYLRRKNYDAAEARARRALAEFPDSAAVPRLLSQLAEALERQGKREEASEVRRSLAEKSRGPGADRK